LHSNKNVHRYIEAYVGRKTTHRVCNSLNFNFRESDDEAVVQVRLYSRSIQLTHALETAWYQPLSL
jgi:hypothetical protein